MVTAIPVYLWLKNVVVLGFDLLANSLFDGSDKSFNVGFEAVGTIKRSDFGIKQYLPLVGDDITLKIAGAFVLQQ